MRLGVIEIGAAAAELLVGDVDRDGHTVVCASRQACGLERGAGYGVLATTGALVSAAADAGAERIVAVVTSTAEHARVFADEAQRVFTIDVEPLDVGAAAALALRGRRGRSAGALHLDAGAIGLARVGAAAQSLPLDLHARSLRKQLAGRLHGRLDGELVVGGPLAACLVHPTGETARMTALVAELGELLGAASVAIDLEAIRAGVLAREWHRANAAHPHVTLSI